MILKKKRSSLFLILFVLLQPIVVAQPNIGEEGFAVIKEAYVYDKTLPLNYLASETVKYPTHTREKFYFTGVNERVGAYLAIPKNGKAPFPVVLLIDGMGGSKERWWKKDNWPNGLETTEALIRKGFIVFTIDAAMHGEREANPDIFPKPLSLRKADLMHTVQNMIHQTVQDYRRGLDYLETREDINIERIGVYGLSMGGSVAFILTGLDERIKTAVTGVAVVYGNQYSVVNAYNFAPRIKNKPFLMLMGDSDTYYTPKTATQLFNTIDGDNNKLIIFKGGHKVPPNQIPVITTWFENELKKDVAINTSKKPPSFAHQLIPVKIKQPRNG